MKRYLSRILAVVLVITMLPLSALASLENHNYADVDIAVSENNYNYYFPDIAKLPDGRLIVCYNQATQHTDRSDVGEFGTVWLTESTDNGYTWSEPWEVVHPEEEVDVRDPNLAVLPDGTLILTWFLTDGGAGTFMKMSSDGGRTWGEVIEVESEIFNLGRAKRGSIAVINNDNIIIPLHGQGDGNNSYGVAATATGVSVMGSKFHRDVAAIHYQRNEYGEWVKVNEGLVDHEITEGAFMYDGTGTMGEDGVSFDGDLYCLARDNGYVYVSHDSGNTWTEIAREEARIMLDSGNYLSHGNIMQPRFAKLTDDCWFVTYAIVGSRIYAYDRPTRPVYGKIFFPEEGWYATQSQLIYDHVGHGAFDTADPATVLTDEGRLLTIYYDVGTQSISGTFSDLEDWLDVDESSSQSGTIDRDFWNGGFTAGAVNEDPVTTDPDAVLKFSTAGGWQWMDQGIAVTGENQSLVSKKTIAGNYSVQFNFEISGVSSGIGGEDSSEGMDVFPLYDETAQEQYRVRVSDTQGVQLLLSEDLTGGTEDVLTGVNGSATEHSLPASLNRDTTYTLKIARIDDGLYVKVWEAGGTEPDWQCEYHDDAIAALDGEVTEEAEETEEAGSWKFRLTFNNLNEDKTTDTEALRLSEMEFRYLNEVPWDWSGMFTASTYRSSSTDISGFTDGVHADWETDVNGFRVYANSYYSSGKISGDYDFCTEFTFHNETVRNAEDTTINQGLNGMTIWPEYRGSGTGNYSWRIILSTDRGLKLMKTTVFNPGERGTLADTSNNSSTSFTVGTTYMLKYSRVGSTLKVKAWEKGTEEPSGWDYEVTDSDCIGGNYPFRMYFLQRDLSSISDFKGFSMYDFNFSGIDYVEERFWKGCISDAEKVALWFDFGASDNWESEPSGYTAIKTNAAFITKERLSGDYTVSFDFKLSGQADDNTTRDRVEGIYVWPFYDSTNPNVEVDADSGKTWLYRIRLSDTFGAQLIYSTNVKNDFNGVLAGANGGTLESTLPSSLDKDVLYTMKMMKEGDGIYLKVWETGTDEPDWQCEYHDNSIDEEYSSYSWKLRGNFINENSDGETAFFSNLKFSRSVEASILNSARVKDDDRWNFWITDLGSSTSVAENYTVGGAWDYSDDGMESAGRNSTFYTREKISGHYTAEMTFTLNGYGLYGLGDGLYVYPLNESTNPNYLKDYKIKLTPDDGLQLYYESYAFGNASDELTDTYTDARPTELEIGTAYTLKVMKAYGYLYIKCWPAAEEEPLGWSAYLKDESIGYEPRYVGSGHSYPYTHSRYGESDNDGNPYKWGFKVNVRNIEKGEATATIHDLQLYKDVEMEINLTELTLNEGETPKNWEMNVVCHPDIYAQLPAPTAVEFTSVNGNVELEPIFHAPGIRVNRAFATGVTAGEDKIVASIKDLVTADGEPATVTCSVTVQPANQSAELKTENDGYLTEVIYAEDFEDMDVNSNVEKHPENVDTNDFNVVDTGYNALSEFFEYRPFLGMSHQAVMQANMIGKNDDGAEVVLAKNNKYLQCYLGTSNDAGEFSLRSWNRIEGDYTFQADVHLPSNNGAYVNIALCGQLGWVKPSTANFYTLGSNLYAHEKQEYTDYGVSFRRLATRVSSHRTDIHMYSELEQATGWQTVKFTKAGDTFYFKSWAKGTTEPDWEIAMVDDRMEATDEELGGGYLSIEIDTAYTDATTYDNSTAVLLDNILVTRNYSADAPMYNVTLVTNGGTIQEGCEVVSYIEGVGKTLPTAAQMAKSGYTFAGWYESDTFDPTTAVTEISIDDTGDKTYYAKWLADNTSGSGSSSGSDSNISGYYTIIWADEDGTVLETDLVSSGLVPTYDGETPVKAADDEYTYEFTGWDPEIVSVTGDATYTAQYKATAIETEVTGSITNGTRSLSLDGAIIINQYVTIDGFEGIDLEANGGLLTFKEEVTEETATVEYADYDQEGLLYDSSKDRYRAQSHGIAAKEYGDTIYLRAYVKDDNGNYHYGDLVTYSVREYCETALEKSSNQKLKNTCIAMLHYGAAAQVYFKYNTDKLANAGIAESYPNFDWDETLLDAAAEFTTSFETSAYSKISSKSLSLDGTILINFYSTVNTVTAAKVELLLWKGVTGELTLDNVTEIKETTYDSAKTRYGAQSMEIAAKEYSDSIAACAKVTDTEGNEYYSEIVAYSPEVYAADGLAKSSNTNLHDLVKAMTIYGEKASIYFGG